MNSCDKLRYSYLELLQKHHKTNFLATEEEYALLDRLDDEFKTCLKSNSLDYHKKFRQQYYHNIYSSLLKQLTFAEKIVWITHNHTNN